MGNRLLRVLEAVVVRCTRGWSRPLGNIDHGGFTFCGVDTRREGAVRPWCCGRASDTVLSAVVYAALAAAYVLSAVTQRAGRLRERSPRLG